MRGNKGGNAAGQKNSQSSPLKDGTGQEPAARDSNQPDSGASTFQEGTGINLSHSVMEADNSQLIDQSPSMSQEVSSNKWL